MLHEKAADCNVRTEIKLDTPMYAFCVNQVNKFYVMILISTVEGHLNYDKHSDFGCLWR
jgi:hypothetical protein